jgi:phosphate transport system protein
MYSNLEQEIERIKVQIMDMFALTERALDKSLQALVHRDDSLVAQVLKEDKKINRLEVEIEQLCLSTLALSQPVARDLRFVVGCSRTANNLERIGDQATNIAKRAKELNSKPEIVGMNNIQDLGDIVHEMLKKVVTAFSNLGEGLALEVSDQDDQADDLNLKIIEKQVGLMAQKQIAIEESVHIILVSNYLERVGDLVTNIAEHVIFMAKGLNVKHLSQFEDQQ